MKTACFNRFSIDLPDEAVSDCHHQGACDDEVDLWARKLSGYMLTINPSDLRAELKEYGAWNAEELADHEQNIRRIIWIAAGRGTFVMKNGNVPASAAESPASRNTEPSVQGSMGFPIGP